MPTTLSLETFMKHYKTIILALDEDAACPDYTVLLSGSGASPQLRCKPVQTRARIYRLLSLAVI